MDAKRRNHRDFLLLHDQLCKMCGGKRTMVMQQIQLFAAHIIAKRMLKRPPKPVFILLAQREGFVAVYLVRIAGILHAGHARRNHHHFAELVLNDVGIVERRRGCAVKRGRERVVHQSDLELQCPHRFLLSWLYLFL